MVCRCLGWLLPGFQERLRPGARAALGQRDHRVGLPNSESCCCRFCCTGDTALAAQAFVRRIQMDYGASGDVGLTTVSPSGSRGTREAGAAGNTRCSQRGAHRAHLGRGAWPRPLCGHQRSLGPGATSKGEKQGRRGPRCCRPGAWQSQGLARQADETPRALLHVQQNLEDFGSRTAEGGSSPRSWRLRVAFAGLGQLEATEAPGPQEAPSGEARPGAGSPGQDALTVFDVQGFACRFPVWRRAHTGRSGRASRGGGSEAALRGAVPGEDSVRTGSLARVPSAATPRGLRRRDRRPCRSPLVTLLPSVTPWPRASGPDAASMALWPHLCSGACGQRGRPRPCLGLTREGPASVGDMQWPCGTPPPATRCHPTGRP